MLHQVKLLARRHYLRGVDTIRKAAILTKKSREAAQKAADAQKEEDEWQIYLFNKERFKLWVHDVEFDRAFLVHEEVRQQLDEDFRVYRSKDYSIEFMPPLPADALRNPGRE
jgi:hypothetical protein